MKKVARENEKSLKLFISLRLFKGFDTSLYDSNHLTKLLLTNKFAYVKKYCATENRK